MNQKFLVNTNDAVAGMTDAGSKIQGYFDRVADGCAHGWAFDPEQPERRLVVEILCEGEVVATGKAELFREDLQEKGIGDGRHHFCIPLPERLFDAEKRDLCARLANSLNILPGCVLLGKKLLVNVGHLDTIDDNLTVTGWAIGEEGKTATVEIHVNGNPITRVVANIPRPDLVGKKNYIISSGFKYRIPNKFLEDPCLKVSAFIDGIELEGSPCIYDLTEKLNFELQAIKHGTLSASLTGWPGIQLDAQLLIDGQPHEILQFKRKEDDPYGSHRLVATCQLPENVLDARPHVYSIVLDQEKTHLQSDPQILSYPRYRLYIDAYDANFVLGWCFRDDIFLPLVLSAVLNDDVQLDIEIGLERTDVKNANPEAPLETGFRIKIPWSHSLAYTLALSDEETGILISKIHVASWFDAVCQQAQHNALAHSSAEQVKLNALGIKQLAAVPQDQVFTTEILPLLPLAEESSEVAVIIPVYDIPFHTTLSVRLMSRPPRLMHYPLAAHGHAACQ